MRNRSELPAELAAIRRSRISRRGLLTAGAAAALTRPAVAAQYTVGVGRGTDAYATTLRAIDACPDWAGLNLAGKVVVIKPNLVAGVPPQTGITTDAQVVRAIIDRALAAGAVFAAVIEAGPTIAPFNEAGYAFLRTYDSGDRIRLVDLRDIPTALIPVSGGLYRGIYSKPAVLNREYVVISAAKMKMHAESTVTLGAKNMFGLPAIDKYISGTAVGRFGMHDRGLHQAIVDTFLMRPPNFTIIDGVVAMEGNGPWAGRAVQMNTVLAGANTLATDRVALAAMGLGQNSVRYLNYMSLLGMGPSSLAQVTTTGDTLAPRTFQPPTVLPPSIDPPRLAQPVFTPGNGRKLDIQLKYFDLCDRAVSIQRVGEENEEAVEIRSLAAQAFRLPGTETLSWDGYLNDGSMAAPGRYAVHVRALRLDRFSRAADATSWVTVQV